MKYELLQKLKDAGFPSKHPIVTGSKDYYESGEHVSVPTLEELIDACGDYFALFGPKCSLKRTEDSDFGEIFIDERDLTEWVARGESNEIEGLGETPEEAVAKLWLALQKNKE